MKAELITLSILLIIALTGCDSKTNSHNSAEMANANKPPNLSTSDGEIWSNGRTDQSKEPNSDLNAKYAIASGLKNTAFDESLAESNRLRMLGELAKSTDPQAIRILIFHIDVPFLDPEKQNLSTLLTSRDWEVFPCMQILKKKGEIAIPLICEELENPSQPVSIWYREQGEKQRMLLRVLRSLAGEAKAQDLLRHLKDGNGKSEALRMFEMLDPH